MSISDAVVDLERLEKRRRQTAKARQALAQKFPTPEARKAYYRAMGQEGQRRRLTLPGNDAEKLRQAFALLRSIRALRDLDANEPPPEPPREFGELTEPNGAVSPMESTIGDVKTSHRGVL
jgi:hypothetical protein